MRNPLFVVRDGEGAIKYLSGVFPFSDRAVLSPALLLLDLNWSTINRTAGPPATIPLMEDTQSTESQSEVS
jgi:hypothetical protein